MSLYFGRGCRAGPTVIPPDGCFRFKPAKAFEPSPAVAPAVDFFVDATTKDALEALLRIVMVCGPPSVWPTESSERAMMSMTWVTVPDAHRLLFQL